MPRYDTHIAQKADAFRSSGQAAHGSQPRGGVINVGPHSFFTPYPREVWWVKGKIAAYVRFKGLEEFKIFHSVKMREIPNTSVLPETAQKLLNALEFVDTFSMHPETQLLLAVKANGIFSVDSEGEARQSTLVFGGTLIRAHWMGGALGWKIDTPKAYPKHHLMHPALIDYYESSEDLLEAMQHLMASLISAPVVLFAEREAVKVSWKDRNAWIQHNVVAPCYVLNFGECAPRPGSTIISVNPPNASTSPKPRTPSLRLGPSWFRFDGLASSHNWVSFLAHVDNVHSTCKTCHTAGVRSERMLITGATCSRCSSKDWHTTAAYDTPPESLSSLLAKGDPVDYSSVFFDGFCPSCREEYAESTPIIHLDCPTCGGHEGLQLPDVVTRVTSEGRDDKLRGFCVFSKTGKRGVLSPEEWADMKTHNLDIVAQGAGDVWAASSLPNNPLASPIYQVLSPVDQALLIRGAMVPPDLLVAERR